MSQVAERKRPDPYADENTILRRKKGVTIGAYQGLTIAVLACLVGALFFLGVNTTAQKGVSVVALVVAAAFLFTMARRKSRNVESDRTQMIVAVWLVGTALCWVAMAVVLFLPPNVLFENGPLYATVIGATGVLMTAAGALTLSSIYGRDWASRKGRTS
ncbi:MAG: cation transporting ATPase C-terminal domain-containing protein [Gemmatimonadota bacterium]